MSTTQKLDLPKKLWIRYNKNHDEPDKISNVERHKKAVLKLCTDPPNVLEQYEVTIPRSLQTETSEYKWPKVRKVTSQLNRKKLFCFFYVTNEYHQEVEKCSKCREDDKSRGICQREDVQRGFLLARCDRVSYNPSKKKSKLPVVFLCRPSDQVHSQELYVDIYFVQVEQPEIVEFHGRAQLTYRKGSSIKKHPELKSPPLFHEITPQLPLSNLYSNCSSFSTSWNIKQDKRGSRIQQTQNRQHQLQNQQQQQYQRYFHHPNQSQLHGPNFLEGNLSSLSNNNSLKQTLPNGTTIPSPQTYQQPHSTINTINTINIHAVNYNSSVSPTSLTSKNSLTSPQFSTNNSSLLTISSVPSSNPSNPISSTCLNSNATIPSSIVNSPTSSLLNLGAGAIGMNIGMNMGMGTSLSPNVLMNPPSHLTMVPTLNGIGTPVNLTNAEPTLTAPINDGNPTSIGPATHGGNSMNISVSPTTTHENININIQLDNQTPLWEINTTNTITQQNVNNLTIQNEMQKENGNNFSSLTTSSSSSSSTSVSSTSSICPSTSSVSSCLSLSASSSSLDDPIKTESPSEFNPLSLSTPMHMDMDMDESINALLNSICGKKRETMDWVMTPSSSFLDEKDKTCLSGAEEMFDCMIFNKMTEFSQLQLMYDRYKDSKKKKDLHIESLVQMVQKLTEDMKKLTEDMTKLKEENHCLKTCFQNSENETYELRNKYETLLKQHSIFQQSQSPQSPQTNDSRPPSKRQIVDSQLRKAVQAPRITALESHEDFVALKQNLRKTPILSRNNPTLMIPINTLNSNLITNQSSPNMSITPFIAPTPTKPTQFQNYHESQSQQHSIF